VVRINETVRGVKGSVGNVKKLLQYLNHQLFYFANTSFLTEYEKKFGIKHVEKVSNFI